jgi:hypothetical protein
LPADHPLGTAALPGEPTQRAEVPLARRQPSSASAALASGASVALLQAGGGGSAQGAAAAPPAGDAVRPGQPGVGQQPGAAGGAAHAAAAAGGSDSDGDGDALPMHPLCPLDDAHLPLDTASLKSRQLGHALQLLTGEQGDAGGSNACAPPSAPCRPRCASAPCPAALCWPTCQAAHRARGPRTLHPAPPGPRPPPKNHPSPLSPFFPACNRRRRGSAGGPGTPVLERRGGPQRAAAPRRPARSRGVHAPGARAPTLRQPLCWEGGRVERRRFVPSAVPTTPPAAAASSWAVLTPLRPGRVWFIQHRARPPPPPFTHAHPCRHHTHYTHSPSNPPPPTHTPGPAAGCVCGGAVQRLPGPHGPGEGRRRRLGAQPRAPGRLRRRGGGGAG